MSNGQGQQRLQGVKEGVTAILGIAIVSVTLYLVWLTFSYAGDQTTKISDAKDVLIIMTGMAGVVLGYYFGRMPSDARAAQAQDQAIRSAVRAEAAASKIDSLISSSRGSSGGIDTAKLYDINVELRKH